MRSQQESLMMVKINNYDYGLENKEMENIHDAPVKWGT